jgi:small subunit ribosomal protein S2
MKDMLDAGVHFGHQTQRWNPKMKPYVYTDRGGIHIIDLQKSVISAKTAAEFVTKVAADGGRLIFVGTKKQAVEPIKEAAAKCGQFYVTKRWLGGMLTNFQTVKSSVDRLKKIDQMREKGELEFFSKKERSKMEKEAGRLMEYLDGIRDMKDTPSCMFVVDLNKEHIAVLEAKKLGIPIVGIADTNVDPEAIDFPIPGNDDAIRSIKLFANLIAEAFLEGSKKWQEKVRASGGDRKEREMPAPGRVDASERGAARRGAASQTEAPPVTVVTKVNKGRKLVAAGTAEDVEILMEVEGSAPEGATEAPTDADTAETDAAPTEAPATTDAPAKTTTPKKKK